MNPKIENSTLKFLKDLAKNNNRDWFTENKEKYVAANENAVNFVEDLIEKIAEFDEEIGKLAAKKSLFRI